MKEFYNRIEELLKEQKKTKEELIRIIGLSSVQVFYNWKNLKKVPDANTAYNIARYLGTSVEYLLTGEESDGYKDKYDDIKSAMQKVIDEK